MALYKCVYYYCCYYKYLDTLLANQTAARKFRCSQSSIGANAAGVAGVATPQYLTCRGRPVLMTPQYFDKCFIFSASAELLNTASRCHFHLQCAQCTVFNSTVEHEKKIHKFSGKGHSPSPDPTPLAAYGASILAPWALDLRPP